MRLTILKILIGFGTMAMPLSSLIAGTVDGIIGPGEYQWNTDSPANEKWNTDNHAGAGGNEYNDGGGDDTDLNFLGIDTRHGNFQFGVVGGSILSSLYEGGPIAAAPIYIGDIAINLLGDNEIYADPTQNTVLSAGWDYAVRILSVDSDTETAEFQLLTTFRPFICHFPVNFTRLGDSLIAAKSLELSMYSMEITPFNRN